MSAFFDGSSKYLSATLSGTVPGIDDFKLITAHIRINTTIAGSTSIPFYLESSDGNVCGSRVSTTPTIYARGKVSSANSLVTNSIGSGSTETWYLMASLVGPDDGTSQPTKGSLDGAALSGSTQTGGNTDTADFTALGIGADNAGSSNFEGWVADVAIWTPASEAAAQDIIDALYNGGTLNRADNISGTASPIWYDQLYDGINNDVGTALTNNGTTTFSTSIHPSLTGPSVNPTKILGSATKLLGGGGSLFGV